MLQNNNSKIEELSKSFSFKLAEKLEKEEIGLEEAHNLAHKFLMLAKSPEGIEELEKFVNKI